MNAEIITIGTEILIGSILNTNGPYLSRKLTDFGYNVRYHDSVQDRYEDIGSAVRIAMARSDLIFLCGGLGPTQDDMTKQALAHALDIELVFDEKEWDYIRQVAMGFSREITSNNKRQAEFPKGSVVIPNPNGTAPGCMLTYAEKQIFVLPGPPREFEAMVDNIMENYLQPIGGKNFITSLKLANIGESKCESMLREARIESEKVEINTFAKTGEVEIKIIAHAEEPEEIPIVEKEYKRSIESLKCLFSDYIYGEDDKDVCQMLVEVLQEKNLTISFAESVTGGNLVRMITSVPGASQILRESYVTYSNDAKSNVLGVSPRTMEECGVVSQEVASEMSKGLFEKTHCDYVVATTGEAGPVSSTGKDVGTVVFSIRKGGNEIRCDSQLYKGDRTSIQYRSSKYILAHILLHELGEENGRKTKSPR